LFVAAAGLDLAGAWMDSPATWQLGHRLLAAALLTTTVTLPLGVLDAARGTRLGLFRWRRAVTHAALTILAVLIFAASWFLRAHPRIPPDPGILVFEAAAAVLVAAGAAAGWHLRRRAAR
jgi:hypothetical protein